MRDRKREEVYDRWLHLAREDDFVGVQNYEQVWCRRSWRSPARGGASVNSMGTGIYPSRWGSGALAYSVAGVPVLVTEHGLSHEDDRLRADLIPAALKRLRDAMDAGTSVLGYIHWSLLDNWRWIWGSRQHPGAGGCGQ